MGFEEGGRAAEAREQKRKGKEGMRRLLPQTQGVKKNHQKKF